MERLQEESPAAGAAVRQKPRQLKLRSLHLQFDMKVQLHVLHSAKGPASVICLQEVEPSGRRYNPLRAFVIETEKACIDNLLGTVRVRLQELPPR